MVFKILGISVLGLIAVFVLIITIASVVHFIKTLANEDEMYDGYDDFYD